ncbi:MAG TPA: LysM peptidoglycan-binding domain-containing M23 family metallopeptidase [Anaerolineae bacterium]|nr:LysM peptidoglycan-binding domain-containing M23 family metallopeptidase [Anaerolineae bacterium]
MTLPLLTSKFTRLLLLLLSFLSSGCRRDTIDVGEAALATAAARNPPIAAAPTATPPPITPTPPPTRTPPESTAIRYTVRPGDTLSGIAAYFGTSVEALLSLNGLRNADQLAAGQTLQVTLEAQHTGPARILIPDSDLVYGPSYRDFDTAQALRSLPGLFRDYSEEVAGETLTGPEIVERVANEYSVGPRVLLTLLELRGGWLTNADPAPEQRTFPLGYTDFPHLDGLYHQLAWAADELNVGFYGWRLDTLWLVQTEDGGYIQYATALNAGTAGVQRALAFGAADYDAWRADLERFPEVYRSLFGDPFQYTVEPLVPPDTDNPALELPWAKGETWYYTGGPHPGWGSQGAWSALDFAPPERNLGCQASARWVTAAAPGAIAVSENGMVLQDLDDDGFVGTGWVLLYLHMDAAGRVAAGTTVQTGDRIAHPSCEGGVSNATHLHFARRYNGVWMPANDVQWPLTLSGWQAQADKAPYDGFLTKNGQTRMALEDWSAQNGLRR